MTAVGTVPPAALAGKVALPFALVALVWGSTWLVIKDQISTVPPSWTVAWRFVIAAAGMLALVALRRESLRLPASVHRIAALVGLAQFCLNFQFVYRAELRLTSGIVAVLFALLLVPNALLARVFLKNPVTARFTAGSAVAICGIALLMLHEYREAPPAVSIGWGLVLTAAALLSASTANILQATSAARAAPMVPFIAWAMVYGAGIDLAVAWVLSGPPVLDPRPQYWAGVVYLGLVGSVLTFPLYFNLIRVLGAGKAAYNGVAVPVVAMLLSTLFEGYRWSVLAAAGAGLAMAGLLVALSARSPSR